MIEINYGGFKKTIIKRLVLDFNGTLAVDGKLIDGVMERLNCLSEKLEIYVLTADTLGNAKEALKTVNCSVHLIRPDNQDMLKLQFIQRLNPDNTISIGNGRNDRLMLANAFIGIAVIEGEGCAYEAIASSDVVVKSINDALDLLIKPLRLKALLRS